MQISMKAAMANAGITQAKMAELLDVSVVSVNNWVNGKATPDALHFIKFCEVCNVPVDAVLLPKT